MTFQTLKDDITSYTDHWAKSTAIFSDSVADYIKSDWLTRYDVTALCLSHNMRELGYFATTAMLIGLIANAFFQIISLGTLSANPALALALLLSCRYILGKSFEINDEPGETAKAIEKLISSIFGNFVTNEGNPIEWSTIPSHIAQLLK